MTKLLTIKECAHVLGVSPATIRSWVWRRRIAFVKLGRCVRIPAEALEKLIDCNTVGPELPLRSNTTYTDEEPEGLERAMRIAHAEKGAKKWGG